MSKKQVLLMSGLIAVPAIVLLIVLVLNGMSHGGNMFSGIMTVIVAITALLTLFGLAGMPFYVMAFYPAEGFGAVPPAPAPNDGQTKSQKPQTKADEEYDQLGDDDSIESFEDDGEFDDDEFQDDSFSDDSFDGSDFDDEDEFDDDSFDGDVDDWK